MESSPPGQGPPADLTRAGGSGAASTDGGTGEGDDGGGYAGSFSTSPDVIPRNFGELEPRRSRTGPTESPSRKSSATPVSPTPLPSPLTLPQLPQKTAEGEYVDEDESPFVTAPVLDGSALPPWPPSPDGAQPLSPPVSRGRRRRLKNAGGEFFRGLRLGDRSVWQGIEGAPTEVKSGANRAARWFIPKLAGLCLLFQRRPRGRQALNSHQNGQQDSGGGPVLQPEGGGQPQLDAKQYLETGGGQMPGQGTLVWEL